MQLILFSKHINQNASKIWIPICHALFNKKNCWLHFSNRGLHGLLQRFYNIKENWVTLLQFYLTFTSTPLEVFLEYGVLKICSKFTWEHQCRSVISIMLLCNVIEITLRRGCSPVNLLHIFRTDILLKSYFCMGVLL